MQRTSNAHEVFTGLKIRSKKLRFTLKVKIDTGAGGNTLPLRSYNNILQGKNLESADLKIRPTTVNLTAYNGTPIRCHGKIDLPVQHGDRRFKTTFYVVDSRGPAIVGLPSCKTLDLVRINCPIATVTKSNSTNGPPRAMINTKSDLLHQYPDQFDRIGELPGTATILLKEGSTPYVDPPRKWPIHVCEPLTQELERLVTWSRQQGDRAHRLVL